MTSRIHSPFSPALVDLFPTVELDPRQHLAEKNRFSFYAIAGFFTYICPAVKDMLVTYLYSSCSSQLNLLNDLKAKAGLGDDLARLDLAFYWLCEKNHSKSQEYLENVTSRKDEVVFLSLINQGLLSLSDRVEKKWCFENILIFLNG